MIVLLLLLVLFAALQADQFLLCLGEEVFSGTNYSYRFSESGDMKVLAYRLPFPVLDLVAPVKFGTPVILTETLDFDRQAGTFCVVLDVVDPKRKLLTVFRARVCFVELIEEFDPKLGKHVCYFPVSLAFAAVEQRVMGEALNALKIKVE